MAGHDPPTPFDSAIVARVAADHVVAHERLAELLSAHQAGVEAFPGVENLVYEWRKQFEGAVIERTDAAYYVAAPPWVWDEFATALDAADDEQCALEAVHAAQVRAQTDVTGVSAVGEGEQSFVVLERPD